MSHLNHPYVYPAFNARLSQLVREAKTNNRRVEVVFLGDSMAVGAGASGAVFCNCAATETVNTLGLFATVATPWVPGGASNGISDFGIGHSINGGSTLNFPAASVVPLLEGRGYLLPDSTGNGAISTLQDQQRHTSQFFQGHHNGWRTRAGVLRQGELAYQGILVDNTVIAGPNATAVLAEWRSNTLPKNNFSATLAATHNPVTAELISGGWHRFETPTCPSSTTNPFISCRIRGTAAGQTPGLAAARFILKGVGGFAFTGIGKGGARANDLNTLFSGCGHSLRAMGADVVVFAYGTNDAGGSVTAANFKIHTQTNIDLVRAALPDCVIILLSGVPRLSAGDALLDTYIDKMVELANENQNVVVFNERAKLNTLGFNAFSEGVSIAGAVVYNPASTYNFGDVVYVDSRSSEMVQGVSTTGRCYFQANDNGLVGFHPGVDDVNKAAWVRIKACNEDNVHLTPYGEFRRAQSFSLLFAEVSSMGLLPIAPAVGTKGRFFSRSAVSTTRGRYTN